MRNLCRHNNHLADRQHPSQWHAGRWLCCGETARFGAGCEAISWTPRQAKMDSTVPPLPASALAGAAAAQSPKAKKNSSGTAATAAATVGNEEGENGGGGGGGDANVDEGVGAKKSASMSAKVVIAVYPFTAIEEQDLTLVKGEEYIVLDDSQEHWWQVRQTRKHVFYAAAAAVVIVVAVVVVAAEGSVSFCCCC